MTPSVKRYCDVCGAPVPDDAVCIVRYDYLYCPDCERIHRNNEEIERRRREKCFHEAPCTGWGY